MTDHSPLTGAWREHEPDLTRTAGAVRRVEAACLKRWVEEDMIPFLKAAYLPPEEP